MKTQYCDECEEFGIDLDEIRCHAGFRPRFYKPTSAIDNTYGYKRKCKRFRQVHPDDARENKKDLGIMVRL